MARTLIPLSECGLLSRANARRYCGCLGEERFDREVGPHVTPRLLGGERFYRRSELDAWIALDPNAARQQPTKAHLLDQLEDDLDQSSRR